MTDEEFRVELKRQVTNAFFEGMEKGIERFAWMKDGTYYVGTTGKTLKTAQAEIEDIRTAALEKLQ